MNYADFHQCIPTDFFTSPTNTESALYTPKLVLKKRLLMSVWVGVFLLASLVFLYPFFPMLFYRADNVTHVGVFNDNTVAIAQYLETRKASGLGMIPDSHTLVIPKIGVQMPIRGDINQEQAWAQGAWQQGSTPEQGSNTILSAHRFRYLPPHRRTFYLLDKLVEGDMFSVFWNGKEYVYRVREQKVVSPNAVEILAPSKNPIITLVTCHPLFSTAQRLVVIGELVGVHDG